jgi:hypothetical protein
MTDWLVVAELFKVFVSVEPDCGVVLSPVIEGLSAATQE